MTAADNYVSAVQERLAADGCAITHESIGSTPVVIGYRAQMRAMSKMHIFVVVTTADRVAEADVHEFVDAVVNLATERKGQWRGLQSGIIVLPVLVAQVADADATALTRRVYRLNMEGFAVLAQPAIVELVAGKVQTFRGTRIWGYAFNSLIKKKYKMYLPEPVVG